MRDLKDAPIIFELVLIGFQVIVWVSLLTVAIFGYTWIDLASLKQWSTEISVGLVGLAYMFGLTFDKAVSSLPYSWIIGGGSLRKIGDKPHPLMMRMEILAKNADVFDVVEKRLNQHRLVRASVFNLALIFLSALVFFIAQIGFEPKLFIVLIVLAVFFVYLALFTGRRSGETIYLELFHLYKNVSGPESPDSTT